MFCQNELLCSSFVIINSEASWTSSSNVSLRPSAWISFTKNGNQFNTTNVGAIIAVTWQWLETSIADGIPYFVAVAWRRVVV